MVEVGLLAEAASSYQACTARVGQCHMVQWAGEGFDERQLLSAKKLSYL